MPQDMQRPGDPASEGLLRITPLHPSCNRPNLFLGGDRRLVIFGLAFAVMLIFTKPTLVMVITGLVLAFGILWTARKLAKSDPLLISIYLRHTLYRRFYPPQSGPWRENGAHEKKIWGAAHA